MFMHCRIVLLLIVLSRKKNNFNKEQVNSIQKIYFFCEPVILNYQYF